MRSPNDPEAWIRMIGVEEALAQGGELAEHYQRMRSAAGSRPKVYDTPNGEAPNIVRSHSLDPEGMRLAFGLSTAIHWGPHALPWPTREMINTVTSHANDCFY